MISFQAILRKHILNPKDLSEKGVGIERTSGQKVAEGFSEASWSLSHTHSLFLEKEGTLYLTHRTQTLSKPAGPYARNRAVVPLMNKVQALESDRLGC